MQVSLLCLIFPWKIEVGWNLKSFGSKNLFDQFIFTAYWISGTAKVSTFTWISGLSQGNCPVIFSKPNFLPSILLYQHYSTSISFPPAINLINPSTFFFVCVCLCVLVDWPPPRRKSLGPTLCWGEEVNRPHQLVFLTSLHIKHSLILFLVMSASLFFLFDPFTRPHTVSSRGPLTTNVSRKKRQKSTVRITR